jgi:LPXTG-motif cell wall-anchored protein
MAFEIRPLRAVVRSTVGVLSLLASVVMVSAPPTDAAPTFECRDVLVYFVGAKWPAFGDDNERGVYEYEISQGFDTRRLTMGTHEAGAGDGYDGHRYDPDTDFNDLAEAWAQVENFGDRSGGPYFDEVNEGVAEVLAYLNDRALACPNELWLLGGYLKGAHVLGDVLRNPSLSARAKDKIVFTSLFGDPALRMKGHEGLGTAPACSGRPDPWVRGNIDCWADGGVLASTDPYLPSDLRDRVGSWCDAMDSICAGNDVNVALNEVVRPARYWDDTGAASEAVDRLRERRPDLPADMFTPTPRDHVPETSWDVVVAVDTTASMADDLDRVRVAARSIADKVYGFVDGRMALVQFKGAPSIGGSSTAQLEVPLTYDRSAFDTGLEGLSAGGADDDPAAVYSGINAAVDQLPRNRGRAQVVVVVTDAPGEDPEPGAGYTADQVVRKARDEAEGAQIYPMVTDPAAQAFFEPLTAGTNGHFLPIDDVNVGATLMETWDYFRWPPVAKVTGLRLARPGDPVFFDASASYDPDSDIATYAWDFDGDGTSDQFTTTPTTTHTYSGPIEGEAKLAVISADFGIAETTTPIVITQEPLAGRVLPPPSGVVVTPTEEDGMVRVAWDSPDGPPHAPWGWIVTPSVNLPSNGRGSVAVPNEDHKSPEAFLTTLPPGATVTVTVWPVGPGGRGIPTTSAPFVAPGTPLTTTSTTSPASSGPTTTSLVNHRSPRGNADQAAGGDADRGVGSLPITGANLILLVVLGVVLMAGGTAFIVARRRISEASSGEQLMGQ